MYFDYIYVSLATTKFLSCNCIYTLQWTIRENIENFFLSFFFFFFLIISILVNVLYFRFLKLLYFKILSRYFSSIKNNINFVLAFFSVYDRLGKRRRITGIHLTTRESQKSTIPDDELVGSYLSRNFFFFSARLGLLYLLHER